jgi:hypothetical protein
MDKNYLRFPEKTDTNIWEEFNDPTSLWDFCRDDFKKHKKRALDKRAKPVINGLISFSEDWHLPNEKDRRDQFEAVKKFITNRFGEKALLYINQQNDEKGLHYSFCTINYDFENHKTLSRSIDTSKLQDEVADFLKKEGQDYGHIRGVSKKKSGATNLSLSEARASKAEEKLIAAEQKLKEIEKVMQTFGSFVDVAAKVSDKFDDLFEKVWNLSQNQEDAYQQKTADKLAKLRESYDNAFNGTLNAESIIEANKALEGLEKTATRVQTSLDRSGKLVKKKQRTQVQVQAQSLNYKKIDEKTIIHQAKSMGEWIVGQKEMDENWKDYGGHKFLLVIDQYITKGIDPAIHDKIISMAKDAANFSIALGSDEVIINYGGLNS